MKWPTLADKYTHYGYEKDKVKTNKRGVSKTLKTWEIKKKNINLGKKEKKARNLPLVSFRHYTALATQTKGAMPIKTLPPSFGTINPISMALPSKSSPFLPHISIFTVEDLYLE